MEIAETVKKQNKICLILLSVIFLLLSFSFTMGYYVILILGTLALLLTIYLAYPNLKKFDFLSLLIYLIPVAALGVFYSIGGFSLYYVDLATRIMIPFVFLIFGVEGILLFRIPKFEIKWIFRSIFVGISLISLINLISTLYNYGPFYGLRFADYYSYYDGTIAKDSLSGVAYALCGFSIKQVPIIYYLIFPCLGMGGIIYFLLNKRKELFDSILGLSTVGVSLISIIFVISKISLIIVCFVLFFILVFILALSLKFKPSNKVIRITSIVVIVLLALFFLLVLLNAQANLEGLRSFFSSNPLFNYVFNTNRFIRGTNVLLNGFISTDKLIGFPVLFDEFYEANTYPTNNIFVNQFMYAGIFGFLFMIIVIFIIFNNFFNIRKVNTDNKINKYMPLFFIALFFIYSFIGDVSNIDEYTFTKFVFTPLNPFFLMVIMFGGYNQSMVSEGENDNE